MILTLFFVIGTQDWQNYTNTNFIDDLVTDGSRIYCATQGGLTVFSLVEQTFSKTFTNAEGLPVNQCKCLAFDKDKNLWIGTQGGGLSIFSPSTEKFTTFPYAGVPEKNIQCLAAAGDTILVGSANGLYLIVPDLETLRFTQLQGLASNTILSLGVGRYFWIGTDKGISRMNRTLDSVVSYTRAAGLGGDSAMAIVVSDSGVTETVTIATESGIARFNDEKFDTVVEFDSQMSVRDLVQRQDTFYLATSAGGFRYRPAAGLEPVASPSKDVRSLLDQAGIWFGFGGNEYYGYGLYYYYRYNPLRDTMVAFLADCIRSNSIEDVMTDTAGGIWACHGWPPHQQGISYRDPEGHWHYFTKWPFAGARICGRDSKNRLWFGCWWYGNKSWSADSIAGIARFEPDSSTWSYYNWGNYSTLNVIGALGIDAQDWVWTTHFGEEVITVIDTTGANIAVSSAAAFVYGRGIDFDSHGRVWIASRGGGLVMLDHHNTLEDPADDLLTVYTLASGLPSLEVTSVSVDPQDRVWFGTEKGLGFFDQSIFRLYTKASTNDGLAADYVIRVKTDSWGDVWCLTTGGLSVYHPFENRWDSYLPQAEYLNDYTGLWIDEARGTVLVGSKNGGLSQFTFRRNVPPGLDSVSIHPNPFIPSSGHQRIVFERLPADARIRIYTLNGELVTTLSVDTNRLAQTWQPSPRIASGIYLAVITIPTEQRIKKIAIVK